MCSLPWSSHVRAGYSSCWCCRYIRHGWTVFTTNMAIYATVRQKDSGLAAGELVIKGKCTHDSDSRGLMSTVHRLYFVPLLIHWWWWISVISHLVGVKRVIIMLQFAIIAAVQVMQIQRAHLFNKQAFVP